MMAETTGPRPIEVIKANIGDLDDNLESWATDWFDEPLCEVPENEVEDLHFMCGEIAFIFDRVVDALQAIEAHLNRLESSLVTPRAVAADNTEPSLYAAVAQVIEERSTEPDKPQTPTEALPP
jgi:hypothetical protein